MVTVEVILLMSVIVILAYLVKGVSGFGEGLVMMSFFLFFLDIKFVLPVLLLIGIVGGSYQYYKFRKDTNYDLIKKFFFPLVIGIILGTYLLTRLESELIKMFYALFIILFSLKLLFFDGGVSKKISKVWAYFSGFIGGLLNSFIGTGGPPIVMYLSHINLKKAAFRATCVTTFLIYGVFQLITYSYAGILTLNSLIVSIFLIPAVLIGSLLGMKIHVKISENVFRKFIAVILVIAGILLLF